MFKRTATPAADEAATASAVTEQPAPQAEVAWTDEDEAAYQAVLARRKATKGKRAPAASRNRMADDAVLLVGPAPVTGKSVYSTIKQVVAQAGEDGIKRGELVAKLQTADFASPHAKKDDAAWLKGWVSGAVRAGVLVVQAAGPAAP